MSHVETQNICSGISGIGINGSILWMLPLQWYRPLLPEYQAVLAEHH